MGAAQCALTSSSYSLAAGSASASERRRLPPPAAASSATAMRLLAWAAAGFSPRSIAGKAPEGGVLQVHKQ